jgi:hypothetical protein
MRASVQQLAAEARLLVRCHGKKEAAVDPNHPWARHPLWMDPCRRGWGQWTHQASTSVADTGREHGDSLAASNKDLLKIQASGHRVVTGWMNVQLIALFSVADKTRQFILSKSSLIQHLILQVFNSQIAIQGINTN